VLAEILVEKADAFRRDPATRRSFSSLIGEVSLFLAEGADWRWQRRAVAPIFRQETRFSFVPAFAAMAERQVQRRRATAGEGTVDAAALTHDIRHHRRDHAGRLSEPRRRSLRPGADAQLRDGVALDQRHIRAAGIAAAGP
jgi:cytochrome P450